LLPSIQQPARQIAAMTQTYTVAHSTVVPETPLHFAVVRSDHFRPAPFRFRFQERPFSAKEQIIFIAATNQMPMKCTPSKRLRKPKSERSPHIEAKNHTFA
jgi:hypothetical protein